MRRVLLVEDQKEVLDGLKAFLESSMEGVDILCAANGARGYELAISHSPDVIVVDVMMPEVNGLQMIALLKKDGVRCRFIILTAYERFDFAREAIALGVDDYLTKPVTQRQLYQAVMRQMPLGARRGAKDLYSNVLLQEYLSGADIFLKRDAVLAMSGLSGLGREGWMVGLYELLAAQSPEKLAAMLVGLERSFGEAGYAVNLYHTYGKSLFAVVNLDLEGAGGCALLLERLASERAMAHGGCSQVAAGIDSLGELYKQAETALECARGAKAKFCAYAPEPEAVSGDALAKWLEALRAGDEESAWRVVDGALLPWERGDGALLRSKARFELFWRSAADALGLCGMANDWAEGADSLFALRRAVRAWIGQACRAPRVRAHSPAIQEAMDFISANCGRALSVAYLANRANLSYPYFSTLFAQSAGMTVKRFILTERMRRAGELVRGDATMRIGDVARACGFDDVRYFSTCFKRHYGVTPQEYRAARGGSFDR